MWSSLRNKLAVRTGVTIGVASLALSVTLAFALFGRTYHAEVTAANEQIRQLVGTVSNSAAIAAYLDDTELAREIGRGLLGNDIVAGIEVSSRDNLKVSMGQPIRPADPDRRIFPVTSPFFDEQIGEILIVANRRLIESNAREAAVVSVATMGTLSMLLVTMVIWLVNRQLTRPLRELAQTLHGIGPGDTEKLKPIAGHADDEIGLLVDDVNLLLDSAAQALDKERRLREDIESLAHRFRLIFENASSGIILVGLDGSIKLFNKAFEAMVEKERISDLFRQHDVRLPLLFDESLQVEAALAGAVDKPGVSLDLRLRGIPGKPSGWLHALFSPVRDSSDNLLIEVILYDITERANRETRARREAERDALTGLMNRRACERYVADLLSDVGQRPVSLAVALIDLDRFKPVNDTYGHEAGDRVLKAVASRLMNQVRNRDLAVRWGGDEFVVVYVEPGSESQVRDAIARLLAQLRDPIDVGHGVQVDVGASIGVALMPEQGRTFDDLMAAADEAMYEVKSAGRNAFRICG